MRDLKFEEIQEVNGGDIDGVLLTAAVMDLGMAALGGAMFGPVGALAAAGAYAFGFGAGWMLTSH